MKKFLIVFFLLFAATAHAETYTIDVSMDPYDPGQFFTTTFKGFRIYIVGEPAHICQTVGLETNFTCIFTIARTPAEIRVADFFARSYTDTEESADSQLIKAIPNLIAPDLNSASIY